MTKLLRSLFFPLAVLMASVVFSQSPACADEASLASELQKIYQLPQYQQARWGILVVDDKGKTVYEHDADKLFLPASTTKLYSCAAALAVLGKDHRFETSIYGRGWLKDGKMEGDLILVASGDPTLGGRTLKNGVMAFKDHDHIYADGDSSECEVTETNPLAGLIDLAEQLKAKGVKVVTGDVLIDDRLFPRGSGTGSGPGILTPIVVNDNVVDAVITPASEPGKYANVRIVPESSFLQIDAQVDTIAAGQTKITAEFAGLTGVKIRGKIPLKSKPVVAIARVEDPAFFARLLFIECLRHAGITVTASPLEMPHTSLPGWENYAKDKPLATFRSPPLSELTNVTLKVSHNLYASLLPLFLAVKEHKKTVADGLVIQGAFLAKLGLEVKSISFAGGAGGANADAVTPRATVQLLRSLKEKYPEAFAALLEGMPRLGVDGTLADVIEAASPARDRVRAKTGTLVWHDALNDRTLLTSKALAGLMTTSSGAPLYLALFVNNVPLPKGVKASREGKQLGHVCEIIYNSANK